MYQISLQDNVFLSEVSIELGYDWMRLIGY
jgi:hypothetical protein